MSQRERDTIIHLLAGGVAGTVGAIVTCPLEVVKTRLQSSSAFLYPPRLPDQKGKGSPKSSKGVLRLEQRQQLCNTLLRKRPQVLAISQCGMSSAPSRVSIIQCLRLIVQTEGSRALFKGLGPNIVGVAPSRAIYFCAYSQTKAFLNKLQNFPTDSPLVHILSASCAGFTAATFTNPIWFIKTRLQLDYDAKNKMTVRQSVQRIYKTSGLIGFYKGISASYFGISETVIHFIELRETHPSEGKTSRDFAEFMAAGAVSKTVASCIAYPHEVARTRLREEGNKYRSFWQTLHTVWKEEGKAGIYRDNKNNNAKLSMRLTDRTWPGGKEQQTGLSWCAYCVKAEPVVYECLQHSSEESFFIHVDVGDREFWKDSNCPFRKDPRTHLVYLPTLLRWKSPQRLDGEQCSVGKLVEMLFVDEV